MLYCRLKAVNYILVLVFGFGLAVAFQSETHAEAPFHIQHSSKSIGNSPAASASEVAPSNDSIENATVIPNDTPTFSETIDSTDATSEPTDPIITCSSNNPGGSDIPHTATVWYSYTAPEDGVLRARTLLPENGSQDFDSLVAVWSGTPGNLVNIGCNDDVFTLQVVIEGESDVASDVQNAQVNAGETYLIEVASWEGKTGELVFGTSFTPQSQLSKITGQKFGDDDNDGIRDSSEPGLPGHTIYLDTNGNERLDDIETFTETKADGSYEFDNLSPGLHRVREVLQIPEWRRTAPQFSAILTGDSESPPTESDAIGTILINVDTDLNLLFFDLRFESAKLEGAPTATHIHLGGPDETGDVLFDISVNLGEGFTSPVFGALPFDSSLSDDDVLEKFSRGDAYVHLHTTEHPDSGANEPGEIRGQIESSGTHYVLIEGDEVVFDRDFGNRQVLPANLIVNAPESVSSGEQFAVPLTLDSFEGTTGGQIDLTYDPNVLTLLGDVFTPASNPDPQNPQIGPDFGGDCLSAFNRIEDDGDPIGILTLAIGCADPRSTDPLELWTVNFQAGVVLADTPVDLGLDSATLIIADDSVPVLPLPINVQPAEMTISSPHGVVFNVQPSTLVVGQGQIFDMDIVILAGDQPVSFAEAFVNYDSNVLEVQSITPGSALPETLLSESGTSGQLDYSAQALTGPYPSGEFVLATITFEALVITSETSISFSTASERVNNANILDTPLPVAPLGASVEVIAGIPTRVEFRFEGGARPQPEGWEQPVTIRFLDAASNGNNITIEFEDVLSQFDGSDSGNPLAFVDVLVAPPGVYHVETEGPSTLVNRKEDVDLIAAPATIDMDTLLSGNANGDSIINILDFGSLAASFREAIGDPGFDPRADFDDNGIVNIFDFGLLAKNFRATSPVVIGP